MKEETSSKKYANTLLGCLPESYDDFITSLNARSADYLERCEGLLVENLSNEERKKTSNYLTTHCLQKGVHSLT